MDKKKSERSELNKGEKYSVSNQVPKSKTPQTPTRRKKTVREAEREQKVEAEKIESREFYRRNRKSDSKRSLKVARAGKRRILRANRTAEVVETIGKIIAKNQASKGKYATARRISKRAIERSDRIIQKAVTKNAKLYGKFEQKRYIKELVETTKSEIDEEYEKDNVSYNNWGEKHEDSKIAKIINGFAKADITVKRFTAKADMGIASLYAKAANSMGFTNHAKLVVEEISMAAEERVRYSRVDNEKARLNADRAFGFVERRKNELAAAETFIENLGREVVAGAIEGWNLLNDGVESWIEDIEDRRSRPVVAQRNYNLAFAGGGYVSNSFQSRASNVMNLVGSSLTGSQRGGAYQTNQRNNVSRNYIDDDRR